MKKNSIRIIDGVNVKPWEMHTATALVKMGYDVTFIPSHNSVRTADAYLNDTIFEFKSPEGCTIKSIENNLQKALRYQSNNIVINSYRVKNVRDNSIQAYLIARMKKKKGIKRLIFVKRNGEAIDIGKMI